MMSLSSPPLRSVLLAPLCLVAAVACREPPSSEAGDDSDTSGNTLTESGGGDESPQIICEPGQSRCVEGSVTIMEECAPTGLKWDSLPCEGYEECRPYQDEDTGNTGAICSGPCEQLADTPTSEGCSFFTTGLYQATLSQGSDPADFPDAIVIGNPQPELDAEVKLYFVPFGTNKEEEVDSVILAPGESHVFELDPAITLYLGSQDTSLHRSGVVYHVTSDLPVVAYLHAPYRGDNSNGSTLLLPEHALTGQYVIPSNRAWVSPNYFSVIAIENQTEVTWTPNVQTAGDGWPIDFVAGGETGTQMLNRFDNIRIDTSILNDLVRCKQDLSGTIITANKPIMVISGVRGLRVPYCGSSANPAAHQQLIDECPDFIDDEDCWGHSDYAMEQILPLDYWGQEYVGPASPVRNVEQHYWRIYAGDDDVTVNITPDQGGPIHFEKRGNWQEIVVPTGTDLLFQGDGPFMPVQFVAGDYPDGGGRGSPAMIQMVPTAQFLDRYVVVTGSEYDEHYLQVIRAAGGADVELTQTAAMSTQIVTGWQDIGSYEVATVLLPAEGPYEVHSLGANSFFGVLQYGYSDYNSGADNSSGYGYMGGMKAEQIFIP